MNHIRKIRYMFVICLIIIMTIISNINVFASEKNWQESYLELLDNQINNDSSAYLLCYIDNDDIPELYMWDNGQQCYALYTYYGESILCNTWRNRESMWIYNDKNGYFWATYSTNAAYQYNIFYKLENGSCNEIYSFCIDRSEMPIEKYLINDEDVGLEEYELRMTELESDYPLSSEFQVNGKLSQTYTEVKQYLLDSMEAESNNDTDEPITTEETKISNILNTEESNDKEVSINANHDVKRTSSPKTGDSKPVFCELIVIGFISLGTIILLRKKHKSRYENNFFINK